MLTSSSLRGYGSGFSSTPSIALNTAVFAPMPSASVSTTASMNAGRASSIRMQWRTSRSIASIRDVGLEEAPLHVGELLLELFLDRVDRVDDALGREVAAHLR